MVVTRFDKHDKCLGSPTCSMFGSWKSPLVYVDDGSDIRVVHAIVCQCHLERECSYLLSGVFISSTHFAELFVL